VILSPDTYALLSVVKKLSPHTPLIPAEAGIQWRAGLEWVFAFNLAALLNPCSPRFHETLGQG